MRSYCRVNSVIFCCTGVLEEYLSIAAKFEAEEKKDGGNDKKKKFQFNHGKQKKVEEDPAYNVQVCLVMNPWQPALTLLSTTQLIFNP